MDTAIQGKVIEKKKPLVVRLRKQISLQIMVLFGLAFIVVFRFLPIYGLQLAFKELLPGRGIWEARWVGMKHFNDFFFSGNAAKVLFNTLALSGLKISIGFPMPIIFALLLNELRSHRTRSIVQGISYLPHFLSWVVISGVIWGIVARESGVLNSLMLSTGLRSEPVHFLGMPSLFWPMMVILDIWKEMGWSAIIYMASIASIDPQLYEAARVDGASRWVQTLKITIPAIAPTVTIMLILRVGSILNAGFDQILVFRNSITHEVANILDVYVYDMGLVNGRFGYATAVGLFQSAVGFIMIMTTNKLANRFEMGLW
ncbi:MAG: ABC transporter permease subunit [Oscillospiraceae bacterium]|nr:ABC transporter permease subunit [Oscillospiraceae bacterium]